MIYRWAAFNAFAMALLALTVIQGWLGAAIAEDASYITHAILALFATGLAYSAVLARDLHRNLRAEVWVYPGALGGASPESEAMHWNTKLAILFSLETTLVILGVAGTMVGIVVAFQAIGESGVTPSNMGEVIQHVLLGLTVGLKRTLIGLFAAVWIHWNYRMLNGAAERIVTRILTARNQ